VKADPAETRYGVSVDAERAADLYAQGRSLRQVGAELGVSSTTVSEQLRRAGFAMRRGGPLALPASTDQILELRDQGLTWNEVAERVGMTSLWCMEPLPESTAAKVATLGSLAAGSRRRARPEPRDWRSGGGR
jgi:hypothetical protein